MASYACAARRAFPRSARRTRPGAPGCRDPAICRNASVARPRAA